MPDTPLHATVQDLLDQLRGALRFRWTALVVAWCTALVLWTVIFLIPDTFQASARVFVDTRTTLSEATQGISLGDDINNQIQRVRAAITGLPQLERVAEETNLFAGALTPQARQLVIDKLKKNIDITGGLSYERPSAAVFTISYESPDREKSLQVVDRLLNTFVEGSLGGKREGSEQAQQFLESQIADYGRRLSAAEQRLADFKKRNAGLMAQEQGGAFARLQSELDQLTQAKEALSVAIRKRDALQQQLRNGDPFIAGGPAPGATSVAATSTEAQIEQTQQQLDQLLLRFTDKHPEVIALRETLKELKARQQAEIAAAKKGDVSAAAQVGLAANPVYQQVEEQYNQAQVDIASKEQDVADREQRIESLRTMMGAAPEADAQYAQLTRDYNVTKTQYNTLLQRLDRARLGQQAEATGIVKFEVIDPPSAQFKPVKPNRPLLIAASLLAAIGAGIAAAYGLHLLQPVFVSSRQLAAVTGLQVLGAVSLAWFDRYSVRRRRSGVVYVCSTVALVLVGVGVLLLQSHISHIVRELIA